MTPVALILMPDMLRLCREYLGSRVEVTALVPAARIRTVSPTDTSSPWVRVSRVGGPPAEPRRFDAAYMQFDSFAPAGQDVLVMDVARTVHAAIWASRGYANDQGIITDVEAQLGLQNIYDTSRTPPTPRVYFGVIVKARPA